MAKNSESELDRETNERMGQGTDRSEWREKLVRRGQEAEGPEVWSLEEKRWEFGAGINRGRGGRTGKARKEKDRLDAEHRIMGRRSGEGTEHGTQKEVNGLIRAMTAYIHTYIGVFTHEPGHDEHVFIVVRRGHSTFSLTIEDLYLIKYLIFPLLQPCKIVSKGFRPRSCLIYD